MKPTPIAELALIRSALFVPGNRPDRMDKAVASNADAVICDLEDAVPISAKAEARRIIAEKLPGYGDRILLVRINGLETDLAKEDVMALPLDVSTGIVLPKTEHPDQIHRINELLLAAEEKNGVEPGKIKLLALVESALGVENAFRIASCVTKPQRLWTLALGAADLAADVGFELTKTGEELAFPRAGMAIACRAAGLESPIDTPFMVDLKDMVALEKDIVRAKRVGFSGKMCIHPNQLEPCNRLFSPSPEELEQAKRIVEAYRAAEKEEQGAIQLDGKFIDPPVVERALKIVKSAQ